MESVTIYCLKIWIKKENQMNSKQTPKHNVLASSDLGTWRQLCADGRWVAFQVLYSDWYSRKHLTAITREEIWTFLNTEKKTVMLLAWKHTLAKRFRSAPYGDLIHKQHQGQREVEILGRTMRSYVPPVSVQSRYIALGYRPEKGWMTSRVVSCLLLRIELLGPRLF